MFSVYEIPAAVAAPFQKGAIQGLAQNPPCLGNLEGSAEADAKQIPGIFIIHAGSLEQVFANTKVKKNIITSTDNLSFNKKIQVTCCAEPQHGNASS